MQTLHEKCRNNPRCRQRVMKHSKDSGSRQIVDLSECFETQINGSKIVRTGLTQGVLRAGRM
jgi:hypothetical protein